MSWNGWIGSAALAGALLALPLAARAQLQLAPSLTPPAPTAPLPAPSPLLPPSPLTPPPTSPAPAVPGPPAQEPPPLPLVFSAPGAGTSGALPPPLSNLPPGYGGATPPYPGTAPPAAQPLQPSAPPGPAGLTPAPNVWVPARAAELDVLNKIDSRTRRLSIKAGQSATVGTITIAVKSCEVRPPHQAPDAAAWLNITNADPKAASFQGWMLAREPAVSVLQSPIYDVHLTGCA